VINLDSKTTTICSGGLHRPASAGVNFLNGDRLWTLLIFIALLVPTSSRAQQPPDLAKASLDQLLEMKVYSASRHDQSTSEAPSAVSVITREQIQKYGYRTLADILRSVRGFYTSYDRNYTYVGARGFATPGDYNTRVLLLIDGHRVNDNVYDQAPIGTEFPLDLDLIERVEVIRGPVSSLYGANAFFGIINVITRKPPSLGKIEVSSLASSFNTYNGRLSFGQKFTHADVLVSGSFYGSRGPGRLFYPEFASPSTNFGFADHVDDDQTGNLFATVSSRGFTLQLDSGTREKGIPTASYGTVFNNPQNRTTDSHAYIDLRYEHTFAGTWDTLLRTSVDTYSYRGTYIYAYDATQPTFLTPNLDFGDGRWWTMEAEARHTFFHRHKLTAGAEFRDNLRQDQKNYDVDPFFLYVDSHRSSLVAAGYLQDEFTIAKSLVLNVGVRHDSYNATQASTNPRAALIYHATPGTALKFIYGTAFRAPNAYELDYTAIGQNASLNLAPEKIRTTEAIWEQQVGKHLRFSSSAYLNKISGLIRQVPDPASSSTFTFRNLDNVTSKGLEFELHGKMSREWEGNASYCVQQTQDDGSNRPLGNSPKNMGKLNITGPLVRQKLFAALDAQYTSARGTLAGASAPGFAVFNVTLLGHRLTHNLDLSGSVYNLLDHKYFDPGATEHRQDAIQQDGRTFRVKLTWRLGE
jgi:outer membrane receptor protein involved in Fe transport